MAKTIIKITTAPRDGKYVADTEIQYGPEDATLATKKVDVGSNTVTIAGLGTFTADGNKVSFTADAALNGTVDFSDSASLVGALDFSKTTSGISYAVDADDKAVTLGAGADTIDIKTAAATATVNGYSYKDGDVISVTSGKTYTLLNDGTFAASGESSVKVSTDGTQIYKAKATDDQGSTQYWTGVAEGTANAFDASSVTDKIIIDASTSKEADVKLGSGKSSVTIGAGTVASGSGDDSITATGDLTLSIGRNDGTDTVANNIKGSDTIIFENGKLSRIDKITNTEIDYAQTTVKSASVERAFNVQFGTDASTLGKLQWAAASATLEAATDTTYFYGADNTTTLKAAAAKVSYDLSDSSKFHNIHYVSLQGGTSGAVTLTNDGDTIESAATDALTLTLGQGNDSVSLVSGDRKATTIVTSAVSGQDKIENFKTGFADTSDILQISDLSNLDDITIGKNADGTAAAGQIFFDEKDYISLNGASADDGLLVKFGSDAVKKVAADLDASGTITAASADADIVLGNKDGSTTYSVTGGKADQETTFDLRNTAKYKDIHKIDLSGNADKQVVIGTTDADTISLGSETAKVWGGGSESDTIALKSGHTGAAQIWYGAGDGSDNVTNFKAGDTVYFYGARTAGDIAKGFTFSNDGTNVKITSKTDKHDTLTLSGTINKPLTVQYYTADEKVEETKVSFAEGGAATFATDSLIYVGTATNTSVKAPSTLDNEKVEYKVDLRGDAGSWNAKFYGINTFDASDSYAQYALIGSGKSTLKGGKTLNAYWGGDSNSQTFEGQKGVKDIFWFGAGDGHDTATKGVGSEDVVYLWSTNNIDDVKVTVNGDDVDVIYANENDLTLKNAVAAVKAGLTFMTQNDQSEYTYDFKTQSFNKKTKA
ncbi:MAG: hypothetical protein MR959_00845 [Selenomonas bovis]|nr:hypothetical protein [Selenomonas bovis]